MPLWKQVKHFHEPGHLHELTFSCDRRKPLFSNDDWRMKLAATLDEAGLAERLTFTSVLSEADRLVQQHSDGGHLSSFVQLGDATELLV